MMYGDGWGWPVFHGFGGIFIVFSTLALALVLLAMLRRLGRASRSMNGDDRAMAILRERYARGEITQEQFEEMKRNLE